MKIVTAPENIPAIAPHLLQRFQKSAKSIIGPNVAPKPAHAKETTRKIELDGLLWVLQLDYDERVHGQHQTSAHPNPTEELQPLTM